MGFSLAPIFAALEYVDDGVHHLFLGLELVDKVRFHVISYR